MVRVVLLFMEPCKGSISAPAEVLSPELSQQAVPGQLWEWK